jgi:hypothetical protein
VVTLVPLTWDTTVYDTGNFYDPAMPDRLTIHTTGVYVISGGVRWPSNNLGTRFMGICVNGVATGCNANTDIAVSQYATNDDPGIGTMRLTQQSTTTQELLHANDVVQVVVVQNSGVPLDLLNVPATHFALTWVGPGP